MAKTYLVEVEGVSPYLMHRFASEKADVAGERKSGRKDYKSEAEIALYKDEQGTIYVPATQIEGAIIKSASDFRIAGKGKKTFKDLAKSAIWVRPDCVPIEPQDWVLDERAVVVQKSRVLRYRPRWNQWRLKFDLQVLEDQFPEDILKQILDNAGAFVGIGDFRPRFGRFIVTSFKKMK